MAKYTERLVIKMTPEDMAQLAEASLRAGLPLTVYARELIINQINPLFAGGGQHARTAVERVEPRALEN